MRLMTLRTGLLVWGELLAASPEAAKVIGQAIQNKTDLWTWLRYLSLPANGWAGEVIPIPNADKTCDLVAPDINVGTILEYSSVPCRVTGPVVAEVINNWVAEDEEIAADKRLLTRQIEIIIASLKGAPLEFTKMVFTSDAHNQVTSNWSPTSKAYATPALMAARLMVFSLKVGAKAGYGNAPANLLNFFKNRTSSRFDAHQILAAIAYLESRREGGEFACEGCKFIDEEVFKQIDKNLIAWFNGLSLAKDGAILEEKQQRLMCTFSNQAHGAALELVGTAAYHALYEFGGDAGVTNPGQYEILSADKYIRIPLRDQKEGEEEDYIRVADGDYGRVPDLIMKGEKAEKRYWIEFKSWRRGKNFKRTSDGSISIKPWKLAIKTSSQYPHAHKQHFLDLAAVRGELTSVWEGEVDLKRGAYTIDRDENLEMRANKNRTWIQVWKADAVARKYMPLEKVNDKWRVSEKTIPLKRASPWISAGVGDIITVNQIEENKFDLVQQYLTQIPGVIDNREFKTTIGYEKDEHENKYTKDQVGKTHSTVAPFTLMNMLAVESSDAAADKIVELLAEQISNSEFANFMGGSGVSADEIEELRKNIEDKVIEQMGALGETLNTVDKYTPQWYKDLEEGVQERLAGALGDDFRDVLANFEVPETFSDQFCEDLIE